MRPSADDRGAPRISVFVRSQLLDQQITAEEPKRTNASTTSCRASSGCRAGGREQRGSPDRGASRDSVMSGACRRGDALCIAARIASDAGRRETALDQILDFVAALAGATRSGAWIRTSASTTAADRGCRMFNGG